MASRTNVTSLSPTTAGGTIEATILPPVIPHLISPADVLRERPYIQRLMAGAIVFRLDHQKRVPEILLLQRAPTDSFPLKWEIPAGTCEDQLDCSLVDTAVRELWEEAGLRTDKVLCPVGMRPSATAVVGATSPELDEAESDDGDFCLIKFNQSTWGKITFLVEVHAGTVVIDSNEHVASRWITEQELVSAHAGHGADLDLISEGLRRNICEGFEIIGTRLGLSC